MQASSENKKEGGPNPPSTDASWQFPEHVRDRLKILRQEADEVKRCFTQFSFQAFAFSAVLLGLVLRFVSDHPYVGLAGLLVTFLLLLVTRIGNYKYATANRNYAYELHVHRNLVFKPTCSEKSTLGILELGWEEAMFAWRIVQATLFEAIYKRSFFDQRFIERANAASLKYRWWNTEALKLSAAKHHPGSYLKYMHRFLHTLAIFAVMPACYTSWYYLRESSVEEPSFTVLGIGSLVASILVLIYVWLQMRRDNAQRAILESGLLSIQSSAVVWRCAVVAHFRALAKNKAYKGYTVVLCEQAIDLVKEIDKVHEWLERDQCFPREDFSGLPRTVVAPPTTFSN